MLDTEIGTYRRDYDDFDTPRLNSKKQKTRQRIVELSAQQKIEAEKIGEALSWTYWRKFASEDAARYQEDLNNLDRVIQFALLKTFSPLAKDTISSLYSDTKYAFLDMFKSRRKKSAIILFGTIAIFTVGMAVLGTIVFPGVGTAIGGALGGALGGAIGGVFGSSVAATIITAGTVVAAGLVGSYWGRALGKRIISSKLFKRFFKEDEKMLSSASTDILKKQFEISPTDANKMHLYLLNRENASKNATMKKTYKELRINAFVKPTEAGIEMAMRFFAKELEILNKENPVSQDQIKQLEKEKNGVLEILNAFIDSDGTEPEVRQHLAAFLDVETNKKRNEVRFKVAPPAADVPQDPPAADDPADARLKTPPQPLVRSSPPPGSQASSINESPSQTRKLRKQKKSGPNKSLNDE